MKKTNYLLLIVLFISCERKQTSSQNNVDIFCGESMNEYIVSEYMDYYDDIEENNDKISVNNILIGSWVVEWSLPISRLPMNIRNINSINDIDIRAVNLYGGGFIKHFFPDGSFSWGPLVVGGHGVEGSWHHGDLELLLFFTDWETGRDVSRRHDILVTHLTQKQENKVELKNGMGRHFRFIQRLSVV